MYRVKTVTVWDIPDEAFDELYERIGDYETPKEEWIQNLIDDEDLGNYFGYGYYRDEYSNIKYNSKTKVQRS